jgi:hypothetical protein
MTPKERTLHWLKDESCENCSIAHNLKGSIIFKLLSETKNMIKNQNCELDIKQRAHANPPPETILIMPIDRICNSYIKINDS